MDFVLVHSPVAGPTTWRWVADELRAANHHVVVPDLTGAARAGDVAAFVRAAHVAVEACERAPVLVGHSGAGPLLPLITASMTVFVDAILPPCEGRFDVGGGFLSMLRAIAVDGVLPRWSEWFGRPGVLDALITDPERRDAIERELPCVPLAFFEAHLEAPAGWCASRCAYLMLSERYGAELACAASLGWPVAEHPGNHLDVVNEPAAIASALLAHAALR